MLLELMVLTWQDDLERRINKEFWKKANVTYFKIFFIHVPG
jgi:hypothetical protein